MTDQNSPDIIYTIVDEAPQLAAASLLPIIRRFARQPNKAFGIMARERPQFVLFAEHLSAIANWKTRSPAFWGRKAR